MSTQNDVMNRPVVGTEMCPKCGESLSSSDLACRSCGLTRAHFAGFRLAGGSRTAGIMTQELFEVVEQNWSSTEAHEQFLAAAGRKGSFASAASLYRSAARRRHGDSLPVRQLDRISRMALAIHQVTATPAPRETGRPRYRGLALLLVVLVLGGAGLIGARHKLARSNDAPGEILTPAAPRLRATAIGPSLTSTAKAEPDVTLDDAESAQ